VSKCPHLDKILGLHEPISRRDFLDDTLMASAGLLAAAYCPLSLAAQANPQNTAAWAGYTGEGDYKNSAGNTERVMQNAHAVRDGKFDQSPTDAVDTARFTIAS
jgi:spermidine dehydrogenase